MMMKICSDHNRNEKFRIRSGTLIVLFILLVCNVGCIAPIPLSTMGTTGGKAAVSFNNEGGGQGESFWITQYDDVVAAILRAGQALSLNLKEKITEDDQAFFRFYDDKGERIDLFVERRTDSLTSIKFNVGWFGSVAFGRLFARQIIFELDKSGAFLEDWRYEPDN